MAPEEQHEVLKYEILEETAKRREGIHDRLNSFDRQMSDLRQSIAVNKEQQIAFERDATGKLDQILAWIEREENKGDDNKRVYIPLSIVSMFSIANLVIMILRLGQ